MLSPILKSLIFWWALFNKRHDWSFFRNGVRQPLGRLMEGVRPWLTRQPATKEDQLSAEKHERSVSGILEVYSLDLECMSGKRPAHSEVAPHDVNRTPDSLRRIEKKLELLIKMMP